MAARAPKKGLWYWLGRLVLFVLGWRMEGDVPSASRCVIIAAPHTSNWDAVLMLAMAAVYDIDIHWMVKHTVLEHPLGPLVKRLGGVPVDRRSRNDIVSQMVDEFAKHDAFLLAVPPEGTRKRSAHWKSGFYYIALRAKVPICLGFLDYARKVGGLGPLMTPTGDVERDLETLRAFYGEKKGKYPEQFSTIAFRPTESGEREPAPGASNG